MKLPELLSYVNMEEETWSRMQQTLSDFLKYLSNLSVSLPFRSLFHYHFSGFTVKFTISAKKYLQVYSEESEHFLATISI